MVRTTISLERLGQIMYGPNKPFNHECKWLQSLELPKNGCLRRILGLTHHNTREWIHTPGPGQISSWDFILAHT